MAYVENINATTFRPVYYNSENNIKETEDNSIFVANNDVETTSQETKEEKEEKGGFFNSIGKFFSNIFNGIKNFFSNLFSKKDKDSNDKTIETTEEASTEAQTETDTKKEVPKEIAEKYPIAHDIYYNDEDELTITIRIGESEDAELYNGLGRVCDVFHGEDGYRYVAIIMEEGGTTSPNTKTADIDTKDGEIGYTKQSKITGDCWLLSGVNSLSYTEDGRQIIKDTLEYKDGETIAHLKGAKDYTITDDELQKAKSSGAYSTGDDDMVILELAIEKAFKDIENGEISINSTTQSFGSIVGGNQHVLLELLTGKQSESHYSKDILDPIINSTQSDYLKEMYASMKADNDIFDEFEANNGKDLTFNVNLNEQKNVYDANGNSVELYAPHAYSVKEVDGDNVTIVNPWDSSEETVLSKETVLDTFDDFITLDLSK